MDSFIFDIDGTICPIKDKDEEYKDLIPYKEMVEKIVELKKMGYKIILYTSRNMRTYNGDLDKINKFTKPVLIEWLNKWNIPYDEIIFGKPWPGHKGFYVDDRTIRPKELLNNDLISLDKICSNDRIGKYYTITFNINGIKIRIRSSNKKVIDFLIKMYGDFFPTVISEDYEYSINYHFGIKHVGIPYRETEEDEFNNLDFTNRNLDIYMNEYSEIKNDFIKRMFTTSLIKVLQTCGYTIIHGACVIKNNKAIIISGNKHCGKTTTLMNLLKRGYDYCGNDRLAIKYENNSVKVVAIPFSMGIVTNLDLPNHKVYNDEGYRKVYLDNYEIDKVLNVNKQAISTVSAIIIPKYEKGKPNLTIRKVDNVREELGSNILIDDAIPKDKGFMNYFFVKYPKDEEYIDKIPCYEIIQSENTFDELDQFIIKEIMKEENVLRFTYPQQ